MISVESNAEYEIQTDEKRSISYIHSKNIWLDIRANYEKYFHHSSTHLTSHLGDKAVLELVFRF